jgi:hypothetical protein
MRSINAAGVLVLVAVAVVVPAAAAAEPEASSRQSLDRGVRGSWIGTPLREWSTRVSAFTGRPVIVDRRLDPDLRVSFTARGEPAQDVVRRVAESAGAAVDELEGSIRLVPPASAGLAAGAEAESRAARRRLSVRARSLLDTRQAWRWPAGSRPRDLVAAAAAEAGVTLTGLESLPHDHFPAADLPPLSLAERLDLVLAHFDHHVAWTSDGDLPRGEITPIVAGAARGLRPGTAAAVPPLSAGSSRSGAGPKSAGQAVFTLRLEAPLDQAVAAIADQLGLEPVIDEPSLRAGGIATKEIVRATVTNASREQLLDAMLHPSGVEWEISAGQLRVSAASSLSTNPPPTDSP